MDDLLASLTDAQRAAVACVEGPMLILAGPGSGKTRVITHRVANLLRRGVPGRRVLALTFTNKAAEEMLLRVRRMAPGDDVWMGTFHRFCARLLRRYAPLAGLEPNYSIYDAEDSRATLRRACGQADVDPARSLDAVGREIRRAKVQLVGPEQYQPRPADPVSVLAARVYPVYQQMLLEANAADFDDLLRYVAVLVRDEQELRRELSEQHQYVLVDEYQDTNHAQYAIVRALAADHRNLAVTGDPDQMIYSWRGATLDNVFQFERDFPEARVVRLEQNYRSTKRILSAAERLISHNTRRKHKSLYTDNPHGLPVRLCVYPSSVDEAEAVAEQIAAAVRGGRRRPRDFAVFYRVNALSRGVEQALRARNVPYQVVQGVEFFQRKEVKDLVAYLQLLNNPANNAALLRVINTPPRGLGRVTLGRLVEHAGRTGQPLLAAARDERLLAALSRRAAAALRRFTQLLDRWRTRVDGPVAELVRRVADESGYAEPLRESESPEDQERLANVEELVAAARQYDARRRDGLEGFLEEASLVADTDPWDAQADRVSLMTLHAAKGLEFPVVFIIAVEEGILPHERSREDPERLEEERRLLFVGMTRAEQELQLSLACSRPRGGGVWPTVPSHFLMELPRDEMEVVEPPRTSVSTAAPAAQPSEAADWDQPPAADEPPEWDEQAAARAAARQSPPPAPLPPGRITTAAALAAGGAAAAAGRHPPDAFRQGMIVTHPQYGPGAVVSLSGQGSKRTAVVQFFAPNAGRRTFRLAFSPLQPVQGSEAP